MKAYAQCLDSFWINSRKKFSCIFLIIWSCCYTFPRYWVENQSKRQMLVFESGSPCHHDQLWGYKQKFSWCEDHKLQLLNSTWEWMLWLMLKLSCRKGEQKAKKRSLFRVFCFGKQPKPWVMDDPRKFSFLWAWTQESFSLGMLDPPIQT